LPNNRQTTGRNVRLAVAFPHEPTVRCGPGRLDAELAHRGLTGRQLAGLVGVHEMTISRARRGQPILVSVLRRIAEALDAVPSNLSPTAVGLLAMPGESGSENANAAGAQAAAIEEGRDGAATTTASQVRA
jgi:transcriptional regulator with XRE-family HTH domain